jgi:hypothetical protein
MQALRVSKGTTTRDDGGTMRNDIIFCDPNGNIIEHLSPCNQCEYDPSTCEVIDTGHPVKYYLCKSMFQELQVIVTRHGVSIKKYHAVEQFLETHNLIPTILFSITKDGEHVEITAYKKDRKTGSPKKADRTVMEIPKNRTKDEFLRFLHKATVFDKKTKRIRFNMKLANSDSNIVSNSNSNTRPMITIKTIRGDGECIVKQLKEPLQVLGSEC